MSIFKACDIRGVYPDELDESTAEAIGHAIGSELAGGNCVLGGDIRPSTPGLKDAVSRGLLAAGADVLDVGIVPTPVAYWASKELRARGVVIVTASHNPPRYNGIKFAFGDEPAMPEDVERVRRRVEQRDFRAGSGQRTEAPVKAGYLDWLGRRFEGTGPGMRVLLDAGNGSASEWAPEAFRAAGCEVHELFCEPDGRFPSRSPNPTEPGALVAAGQAVRAAGAGLGVCFDGDADRTVFLDERGDYVPAEEALILLAREALEDEPKAAIVYDLKSTRILSQEIRRAGGRPVMERSGYSFIKRRLMQEDAALGAEASGHFFFRELGGDDGIYAGLKVAELLAASDKRFSELRATIPPYFISEDIRIPCAAGDAEAAVDSVRRAFADHPQDHTDGVRVEFDGGWALCRASVTEPAVTVRVEGDSPERLAEIRRTFLDAIPD